MYEWLIFGLTLIVLLIIVFWRPLILAAVLPAAVLLGKPSHIYPELLIRGEAVSLSLSSILITVLIFSAFIQLFIFPEKRKKLKTALKDPLPILLFLFIAYKTAFAFNSPDPILAGREILSLLILFVFYLALTIFLDQESASLPLIGVLITALILAPLFFYLDLVSADLLSLFVILGLVANFGLQLKTRHAGLRLLYFLLLALLLAELLLFSTSGVSTLALILILTLIILPNRKATLWVIGLGLLCGGIVLFLRPDLSGAVGELLFPAPILKTLGALNLIELIFLVVFWFILAVKLYLLAQAKAPRGNYLTVLFEDTGWEYFAGACFFLWALTLFFGSPGVDQFLSTPLTWFSLALFQSVNLNLPSSHW
jgi:hypothetical protein